MLHRANILTPLLFTSGFLLAHQASSNVEEGIGLEEVQVWGSSRSVNDAGYVSPTSILTQQDMGAINAVTTEDLVKFEPSLVIRRRFIGDSNGTLGIRGSNMFQTARSMVFADGVPLHYLLQSRWNGAPRWTMVAASEIAQVEVVYGPFSAEYSGNAMGGVVLIETAIPQEREFHIDGSYFSQDFNAYGFDDTLNGFKGFISYGDKLGDASIYFSYNHLDNAAQAQTYRDSSITATDEADSVTGGINGNNALGNERIWYGDTGVVDSTTDNLKFKFGYDFGQWQSLLNVAYEGRQSSNSGNSYIKDLEGNTLWSGSGLVQGGNSFSINGGRLNSGEQNRHSLSLGLRVKGELSERAHLEVNLNRFDILLDENRASSLNPNDENFTGAGQISDYDNSGWKTAEVKLVVDALFAEGLELVTGLRNERYSLNLDVYESPDFDAGVKGEYTSRFGGDTEISALFAQANWQFSPQWDAAFGLRYEWFESSNGYYDDNDESTPELDLVHIPSESKNALSPKFSLGYRPQESWLIRYSLAKAFRFPIVEELFSQYEAYNSIALSNPELEPEEGLHHNLMFDKTIDNGYLRVNVFQESVNNAIESQTDYTNNVRSFVPIDKVEVKGLEFIANKGGVFVDNLDLRFNLTWTDAKVKDNSSAESAADFDPANSIEGNTYPRMPEWRSNLLATYHLSDRWNASANVQYASDSYGRIDNSDTENNVYGAQDGYTRIGLKTAYQINKQWNISLGIDNITNQIAYVAHPWPGRTVYLNFSFDM
ncbi:iron complex outermembrane recepter protein [Alteromonadaceae bacterium Bs31]|nr:iron complex outermembrane recepter protein [Alteromonadaceae bacterium Bs31]